VARGQPPYTWSNNKQGRVWQTSFATVGKHEITVKDSADKSAMAIVEVIQPTLSISPKLIYLAPNGIKSLSVVGGTPEYVWSVDAGNLSTGSGDSINYIAPDMSGRYQITVSDGQGKTGLAEAIVTAGLNQLNNGEIAVGKGQVHNMMQIDGVLQSGQHTFTNENAQVNIQFPIELGDSEQQYNVYAAVMWTAPEAPPVFIFRTPQGLTAFDISSDEPYPVYQQASSSDNVRIDFYQGELLGYTGQFDFYLGFAPTEGDVKQNLVFNPIPYRLDVVK